MAGGPRLQQSLKQTQSLVMAPQMRQSLKILQVPALELRHVILEELEMNPTLEEEVPTSAVSIEETCQEDERAVQANEELEFSGDYDVLQKIDEDWKEYFNETGGQQTYTRESAESRQHMFDSYVKESSLEDYIIEQIKIANVSDDIKKALPFIMGSLDEKGFITSSVEDLAELSGQEIEAIEEGIGLLKSLEPHGIGCSDTQDCLLHQLRMKGLEYTLPARIIRENFDLLLRKRIPELSKKYDVSLVEIQEAVEHIGALNPAPGRLFTESNNHSVAADVLIEKYEDRWIVTMNNDYIPRLRISSSYKQLLSKENLAKSEREYIRTKMQSSRSLIHALEQRQSTLERIALQLIEFQKDFLEEGISKMHPLTMAVVAEKLDVHETTVSRAIANKYVQTPHGLFELKYFFNAGYENKSGETMANTSVKDEIAKIINSEPSTKPYSDQVISRMLAEQDIKIARRTVAKYRESLGILPTNLRRQYH